MQKSIPVILALAVFLTARPVQSALTLIANGESRMPIVVFADAPPLTRRAADDLAHFLEKAGGARPEVLEGLPDPVPENAIWVGYQPILDQWFPDLDFDFQHPEEILQFLLSRPLPGGGSDWEPGIRLGPVQPGSTRFLESAGAGTRLFGLV